MGNPKANLTPNPMTNPMTNPMGAFLEGSGRRPQMRWPGPTSDWARAFRPRLPR